jgi:gliding motility associated protien GldN
MNRISLFTLFLFSAASVSAQGWGGGWGDDNSSSSVSVSSKSKKGKGKAVEEAPAEEPAAPAAASAPDLQIATVGTHYDDSAKAHYEPEYVNQDTNLSLVQGEFIPRPYLRQADVKFQKRIWRVIDLRQKLNKNWTWPRSPITQVFWEMGTKGLVRAYANDSFRRIITPEEILKNTSDLQKSRVINQGIDAAEADPMDDYHDTFFWVSFKWEKILQFEIMEDWVFDYKHGEMKPIIIGIAPVRPIETTVTGPDGQPQTITTFDKPFWLRMDDCRPTLAKSQVFNRYNDAMRLNWDQQINGHRLFDSYIVKKTDWDDQYINAKPEFKEDGVATLLEADKIKNDLFIFEHDLWEY